MIENIRVGDVIKDEENVREKREKMRERKGKGRSLKKEEEKYEKIGIREGQLILKKQMEKGIKEKQKGDKS